MTGIECKAGDLAYGVPASGGQRLTIIDISSLSLRAGEVAALAGPSGSGKSTLLYLLAGLLVPDRGQIDWGGTDLRAISERGRDAWRLANAGFVFQSFNLIEELSPVENVMLPARFTRSPVTELPQRAADLLTRFGVPEGRRRASLLSRGEQQRVAVARALLFDPPVIFADEPTASLDEQAGSVISTTLRELADQGKTVVVASHDPAVLEIADRIVRIDHGRIVEARQ